MKLVKRTYRVGEAHDKHVKKRAKKTKVSESEFIRKLITSSEVELVHKEKLT